MKPFVLFVAAAAAAWLSIADAAPAAAQTFTCTPGDRAACHWQGACNAQGTACVCSDPKHYDAREQCATWKQAVVPEGKTCLPGDRSYCSFNGACDAAGATCVCADPTHYSPADQCKVWQNNILAPGQKCAPGDRAYCNTHGACDAAGQACVCDDPLSFKPSDNCQNFYNDIVPPGKLCKPGTRAYCSGNGTCTPDGMACTCDSWWWNGPTCATSADKCPGWGPQPDGSWSQVVCDGGVCIAPGQCESASECTAATPESCDDGNVCTADTCGVDGSCAHAVVSCDDGNACTTDSCGAAGCTHQPVTCGDGQACEPASGSCKTLPYTLFRTYSTNCVPYNYETLDFGLSFASYNDAYVACALRCESIPNCSQLFVSYRSGAGKPGPYDCMTGLNEAVNASKGWNASEFQCNYPPIGQFGEWWNRTP